MYRIAIYDMDKTITRTATFGPFLWHAVRTPLSWRVMLFPLFGLIATGHWALAKLRLHPGDYRKAIKTAGLALIVGRRLSPARAQQLGAGFAAEMLKGNCLRAAEARIAEDRASGALLVLASASNRLYVAEVARLLAFDAAICTDNDIAPDGSVLAAISGPNCYADAKLALIKSWLTYKGIDRADAHIRFYSDHVSDAPCLEWADEAYATNPHPPLRRLAAARGWTVFDWR